MKIGVISDTHGYLNPRVQEIFNGVDMILHAGDIGKVNIIFDLTGIAPLEAVYGNMDPFEVQDETPSYRVMDLNGVIVGLAHGGGSPRDIKDRLKNMFHKDNVKIIVFGHTHEPCQEWIDGVFFFNPGYGRRSVGLLEIEKDGKFKSEIMEFLD